MEYGVNVTNKFASLSGDEESNDPEELIAHAKEAARREKSAIKKDAKKAQPVVQEKKVTIQLNSVNKENVDIHRPPRRDGPRGQGFKTGPRHPRRPEEVTNTTGDAESKSPRNFGNRPPREGVPRFNNNGENRGPRRRFQRNDGTGQRPPRFNRNENMGDNNNVFDDKTDSQNNQPRNAGGRFRRGPPRGDRISGSDKTGVRSIPKKDGHGKGNWGTETDELVGETENAANITNQSELNNEHDEKVANIDEHADENEEKPTGPELPRELTLEEWKAQHKSEEPQFNIRKPGEGDDKKLYQKLVPIKRAEKQALAADEEEVQVRREPREKTLNIAVSFNGSQRNRGGSRGYYREDRGPPAGGTDRRGDRERRPPPSSAANNNNNFRNNNIYRGGNQSGRRPPTQNFNLTQESFPALGAH